MPKTIVFVTMSLWDEPHRGRHHYANLLSQRHTVIWINRHLRPSEKEVKPGIQHIKDGLYVLHAGKAFLSKRLDEKLNLNNRLRLRLLRREMKHLNIGGPDIVWCYDYKGIPFVNEYKNQAICIYFCNDWFGEWTSRFGEWAFPMHEKRLALLADHVVTPSPKLCSRFTPFNPNTHFVPHGLWLPDKPAEYQKKNKPEIAGYIGTLNGTTDVDFLWKVINETDLKLLLAGPITEAPLHQVEVFRDLIGHDRVQYLGNVGRTAAEKVRSDLDILLLPYAKIEFRESLFLPIKYFEYLGAGRPIVSSYEMNLPVPFRDTVNCYNNSEDLKNWISYVYQQWNEDSFRNAIELARKSTWERRVETISELIGVEL